MPRACSGLVLAVAALGLGYRALALAGAYLGFGLNLGRSAVVIVAVPGRWFRRGRVAVGRTLSAASAGLLGILRMVVCGIVLSTGSQLSVCAEDARRERVMGLNTLARRYNHGLGPEVQVLSSVAQPVSRLKRSEADPGSRKYTNLSAYYSTIWSYGS